ncbi:MAG: hypothetical protein IKO56_10565 [Alphaproteobacteria bacterium]|nr:hypothetical protein [Alphaproteobacteria bacterium]
MGYEDVKLNLGKLKPCDLHIGQILYYEKNYILLEVEIVSIDCLLEDTLKLYCKEVVKESERCTTFNVKGSERCTIFKFWGNKNEVFGKNKFVLYNNDLSCGNNSTLYREGTTFYRTQQILAAELIPRVETDITLLENKLVQLKSLL